MISPSSRRMHVRNSVSPLLTIFIVSQLLLWLHIVPVELEKGVEVVRSRGYLLDGDSIWPEYEDGGFRAIEKGFNGFLMECELIRTEDKGLAIHVDSDARVMFVFHPTEGSREHVVFFCRFN